MTTSDLTGNRDDGDLIDIRRFYVQDGKVIPNSNVSGVRGDSITDKVCVLVKELDVFFFASHRLNGRSPWIDFGNA
jgi:hypothetical protein